MRDILIKAKQLITHPNRWTKGQYGEFAHSTEDVIPGTVGYCRLCLYGAIAQAAKDDWDTIEPIRDSFKKLLGMSIANFNDDPKTTHADVMQVLDKAIENASA